MSTEQTPEAMSEPIELTPEDMANRILRRDQLIMSIPVNKGNFQHIIETGKINGSLYDSISNLLITETHLANIKRSIAEKQLESKDARIKELEENYDGMADFCKYLTEINVFNMAFDEADSHWKKSHKVEEGENFIDYYMRHHAAERKADSDIIAKQSERIKELEAAIDGN